MKQTALTLLTALLVSSVAGALIVNGASANFLVPLPLIVITSDGSITPQTGLIEKTGNVYSLTANLSQKYAITIQRSNIVFDGKGYLINGSASSYGGYANAGLTLDNVHNVTVKNIHVSGFGMIDIYLNASAYCSVLNVTAGFIYVGGAGNQIADCSIGKLHLENTEKNTITKNNITDILMVEDANDTSITKNNIYQIFYRDHNDGNIFLENNFWCGRGEPYSLHFFEYTGTTLWDNGSVGNYWFDYDGKDLDFNGVGDTPYFLKTKVFDESANKAVDVVIAQDNYPLMTPYSSKQDAPNSSQTTFLTVLAVASASAAVGAGLFVHQRKRRRSPKT
ncbi:MAG: hypothetical protein ACQCN4_04520 [Candidatus Bathyarchaeia archaeon]|jgi:nitrous oxidase accessory protein NosD